MWSSQAKNMEILTENAKKKSYLLVNLENWHEFNFKTLINIFLFPLISNHTPHLQTSFAQIEFSDSYLSELRNKFLLSRILLPVCKCFYCHNPFFVSFGERNGIEDGNGKIVYK